MGLFSLTKKPEEKKAPVAQPSFPAFPENEEGMPEFPAYEPTIGEIKKEITKPEELDIPIRETRRDNKSMFSTQMPVSPISSKQEIPFKQPTEGRSMFVKIDKYKEAMHDMQNLKAKIAEAERILASLEEIKSEEDLKLERWNSEIQELKEKLLSLDKNLFEA